MNLQRISRRLLLWHKSNKVGNKPIHNPIVYKILERRCSQAFGLLKATETKSNATLGQPTPQSHPHILKPGELVPGFYLQEFVERRKRLIKNIFSTNPKCCHLVLVPSSTTQYMTEKIPYFFRQNSDFRYLTGCLEPHCALVIVIASDCNAETILFVEEKTEHSELWEGPRTGVELASEIFGVEQSKPINALHSQLSLIQTSLKKFVFWYDFTNPINDNVHKSVTSFLSECETKELASVRPKIHELRVIKSSSEKAILKESAEIASRGIEKTMAVTKPGLTEHHLFATMDYYCRMNNAEHLAYPPVVATGNNANIIHYIQNTQQIKDGEMVLMDAGCELHGYCSDITRTWPANGRFTDIQRTIYEIVLNTQNELIAECSRNPISLNNLFDNMCILLGRHLREAHVLTKIGQSLKDEEVGYKMCPHHVGHYLGMDVHDTGNINRDLTLKDGMVITIEPGIYIRPGNNLTKSEFYGMGIRIEDDVLITNAGAEVISNAVKSVDEIERICQSSS